MDDLTKVSDEDFAKMQLETERATLIYQVAAAYRNIDTWRKRLGEIDKAMEPAPASPAPAAGPPGAGS